MQKLIEEGNALNWFEIPVTDTVRARTFYETILDIKMQTQHIEETNEEVTFFPFSAGVIRATSGRVSGVLVRNDRTHPADHGTTVYLNANPSLQIVAEKIGPAGGTIVIPRTKIMAGCFAIFIDTEGNRVGLHARE